jgi:hypothetical protein
VSASIFRKRKKPVLTWTLAELSALIGEKVLKYELLQSDLIALTTESGTIFVNPITNEVETV